MASPTGLVGVREGRVFYDSLMDGLPAWIIRIPVVTGLTSDFSMLGLQERGVDINLFIQLQLSQRPGSPLTGRFR